MVTPATTAVAPTAPTAILSLDVRLPYGVLPVTWPGSLMPTPECCYTITDRDEETALNYMLIMQNEQSALLAIGPVSIEYQAAMLRDEIEESSDWTTLGIARVLSEEQARTAIATQQR